MRKTLVTWSDRGVGGPMLRHHLARPNRDLGPVIRLLQQPESEDAYENAIVLMTRSGVEAAESLLEKLGESIPHVNPIVVDLVDPTDFTALYQALQPVVTRLSRVDEIDILLSAGTPQMQTLWVILVKAGLIDARMLQVIPEAFVPSVHPKAIREVRIDVDGFPEIRALRDELVRLRAHSRILSSHLIGSSPPMCELINRIGRVAPSELPVLISGETGTGKELVARAVHESSHRASGPLITENCGALTESVLTSELFGHERGAFTGAVHAKRGLFELAHGGTLFLDEIGELSPRVQVNLLRVLQDGTLRRLGSEKSIRVDVRIVAATHRNLLAMVREGTFREDLYYRLQGATLIVPPLRDRIEDLEALVSHFLHEVDGTLRITKEAWHLLRSHLWPGNVRELRAEVMRWHVFCDRWVRPEDLHIAPLTQPARLDSPQKGPVEPLASVVASAEKDAIGRALEEANGNLSKTARRLEIDRNTLKRKLQKHKIPYLSHSSGRPIEGTSNQ